MAVMGDLLDRLNYLTYIPLEPEKDLVNMLRDNRCVNSAEILNEQWRWEQLHAQAVDGLDHRKEDIADQVRMNARALCRELRENAVAVEVLLHTMSNGHERSDDLLMFLKSLSELTDLTQSQLEKSLEDAKSKKELMHLAESRMKQAEDDRVSIREKLSELRKTKEEEISLLDSQVEKLKSELQNLNQVSKRVH
jgi:hypothetical protein